MEVRKDNLDLVGYTFSLEELVIIKSAFENSTIRAYIQTQRTNYVTNHILTPLLNYQERGPDTKLNMALDEAYLKGALDLCTDLLTPIVLPGTGES